MMIGSYPNINRSLEWGIFLTDYITDIKSPLYVFLQTEIHMLVCW